MCQQPAVARGIYDRQPARGLQRVVFPAAGDRGLPVHLEDAIHPVRGRKARKQHPPEFESTRGIRTPRTRGNALDA